MSDDGRLITFISLAGVALLGRAARGSGLRTTMKEEQTPREVFLTGLNWNKEKSERSLRAYADISDESYMFEISRLKKFDAGGLDLKLYRDNGAGKWVKVREEVNLTSSVDGVPSLTKTVAAAQRIAEMWRRQLVAGREEQDV